MFESRPVLTPHTWIRPVLSGRQLMLASACTGMRVLIVFSPAQDLQPAPAVPRIVACMDAVYLYGPPAVGKWTIANELVSRTGYRLFHNHLSIDCVRPIFDFGTEPFWRQVHAIREGIMAEAARAGRDLVFTTVYAREESDPQTLRRFAAIEDNGGRVCLVQLTCSQEVLEHRVVAQHRVEMSKIASVDQLRQSMAKLDVFAAIPERDSLVIDTSALNVAEAAARIIDHYGLPTIG